MPYNGYYGKPLEAKIARDKFYSLKENRIKRIEQGKKSRAKTYIKHYISKEELKEFSRIIKEKIKLFEEYKKFKKVYSYPLNKMGATHFEQYEIDEDKKKRKIILTTRSYAKQVINNLDNIIDILEFEKLINLKKEYLKLK